MWSRAVRRRAIASRLRQAGRWLDDEHEGTSLTHEPLEPEDAVLASCYQAAANGAELHGERAGQPTLRLIGLLPR